MDGPVKPPWKTTAPLSRTLGPQLLSLKSSESTVEHHGPFSERPYVNGCYCVILKPGKERTKPAFVGTWPVTKSFSFRSSQDDWRLQAETRKTLLKQLERTKMTNWFEVQFVIG